MEHGVLAVATLLQQLIHQRRPTTVIHGHDGSAWGHAVAGLARSIAREQTGVRLVSVITGANPIATLETAAGEQAAWHELTPAETPVLRRRGTYVISGGLGGIGAIVARHLIQAWDARVVLLGRSAEAGRLATIGPSDRALYIPTDITHDDEVEAALTTARDRFGPLHGVFHAAALQRDGVLRDQPARAMARRSGRQSPPAPPRCTVPPHRTRWMSSRCSRP